VAIGIAVLVASVLMVARSDGTSSSDLSQAALLTLLGVVALFVVVNLGLQLAGFDGEAPTIAEHLALS